MLAFGCYGQIKFYHLHRKEIATGQQEQMLSLHIKRRRIDFACASMIPTEHCFELFDHLTCSHVLCIEVVKHTSENLHGVLHVADAAVLVVAMVDAGVAVTTDLNVKAGFL